MIADKISKPDLVVDDDVFCFIVTEGGELN